MLTLTFRENIISQLYTKHIRPQVKQEEDKEES